MQFDERISHLLSEFGPADWHMHHGGGSEEWMGTQTITHQSETVDRLFTAIYALNYSDQSQIVQWMKKGPSIIGDPTKSSLKDYIASKGKGRFLAFKDGDKKRVLVWEDDMMHDEISHPLERAGITNFAAGYLDPRGFNHIRFSSSTSDRGLYKWFEDKFKGFTK